MREPGRIKSHACHMTLYYYAEEIDAAREHGSEQLQGMYKDFHHIFSQSGFDGDPEKTAFAYFKPHLGNLDFQEELSKTGSVSVKLSPCGPFLSEPT